MNWTNHWLQSADVCLEPRMRCSNKLNRYRKQRDTHVVSNTTGDCRNRGKELQQLHRNTFSLERRAQTADRLVCESTAAGGQTKVRIYEFIYFTSSRDVSRRVAGDPYLPVLQNTAGVLFFLFLKEQVWLRAGRILCVPARIESRSHEALFMKRALWCRYLLQHGRIH